MIKFLKHKDINTQKWDACVSESRDVSIFAYSWYLDIVCEDWCGLVLNDYEAVFPLAVRSRYRLEIIYQPFFTRYFGLYSKKKISGELLNDFLAAIPEKFRHVEFGLHENNKLKNKNYELKERKFQLLELNSPYDALYKDYSDNTKRNLKKAAKKNLKVKQGIAPAEIVQLFKVTKGKELEVFKAKDYTILLNLMNTCVKRNQSESFGIYNDENELLAAGFFMKDSERLTYLKSGLTDDGRAAGAMHMVMDSVIKKYANTNTVLDFGGSSVESVARFYKNFGAKDCVYLQVKKDDLPVLIKWVKKLKA